MLRVVRGLPGSGKTHKAKEIAAGTGSYHFETDMFWMENGVYRFDHSRIKLAHAWCYDITRRCLIEEKDVIVSNTFVEWKYIEPYFEMSKDLNSGFEIIEPETPWAVSASLCHGMCTHAVPYDVIANMAVKWERTEDLCVTL